jgi:hypothetical protein
MDWAEVFIVFVVSHLAGDFLLQTEWQARNKWGGLGRDPTARRALLSHIATYTLAFVPALVWIADSQGAAAAFGLGALIAVPHLGLDDGRFLNAYLLRVKGCAEPPPVGLAVAVDQSFHLISLWLVALLAAS